MADISAVRTARSRAHAAGDHSLCRPEYCDAARAEKAGSRVALAVEEDVILSDTGRAMRSGREAALRLVAETIDSLTPAERVRHLAALVNQLRQLELDLEAATE